MLFLFKTILAFCCVIPILGGASLYFTIRLRGIQFRRLFLAFRLVARKDNKEKGSLSSFAAVSAVLGGNLGTGNIAGVAVALSMGGPGALVWMWVIGLLGITIKYIGCFLGVRYRVPHPKGGFVGGPMYYLEHGLKKPLLAKIFCILAILSAITVGNFAQINSVALPMTQAGISPWILGGVMMVGVGYVLFGDLKRFAAVSTAIVPLMAVGYLGSCLYIIWVFSHALWPAVKVIMLSAFDISSIVSGVAGYSFLTAIKEGVERGLFATDTGVGLAPMMHAPVTDRHHGFDIALSQAIISMLSPVVVLTVCTLTGLVLIVTGVWQDPVLKSTNMCVEAFRIGFNSHMLGHIVTVTLFFFAFTTILTWSFCAQRAAEYLWGEKSLPYIRGIFVALIPIGTLATVDFVWVVADISINLMMIVHMIGIIGLASPVIKETTNFFTLFRQKEGSSGACREEASLSNREK